GRERALEVGRGVLDDDRGAGDRGAARGAHGPFDDARGGLGLSDGEGGDDQQCERQKARKTAGTHHGQKPPCSIRTGAYACGRAREIECNVYLVRAGHIKRMRVFFNGRKALQGAVLQGTGAARDSCDGPPIPATLSVLATGAGPEWASPL